MHVKAIQLGGLILRRISKYNLHTFGIDIVDNAQVAPYQLLVSKTMR